MFFGSRWERRISVDVEKSFGLTWMICTQHKKGLFDGRICIWACAIEALVQADQSCAEHDHDEQRLAQCSVPVYRVERVCLIRNDLQIIRVQYLSSFTDGTEGR